MAKTRRKSRDRQLVPQPHGGALLPGAGRGCKPGAPNAGRPPDEWRKALRGLASRDEVIAHIETVLVAGPDHPQWFRALEYATDHGFGKAGNTLTVTPPEPQERGAVFILPAMNPRPEPPAELVRAEAASRLRSSLEELRLPWGLPPK